MNKTKQREPEQFLNMEVVRSVLKGVGVAFLLLFIFLFFAAFAIDQGRLTQEHIDGIILVSVFISTLLGSLLALSKVKIYKVLVGIFVGLLLFSLLFLLGTLCYPTTHFANNGFDILFASLVGGGIAKIFSGKKKKNY